MRVATNTFYDNAAYAIQLAQSRLVRAQTEISSNSKLQTAADNPTDAVQVLRISQLLSENTQYRGASDVARNRLELEETALSRMGELAKRARELTVQLGNDSLSTGARRGIGAEADALLRSMAALANTQDADGARMFAGNFTSTTPVQSFVSQTDGKTYWTYNGDETARLIRVSNTRQLPTASPGSQVFFDVASPVLDAGGNPVLDASGNPVKDSVFAVLQDLVAAAQTPAPVSVGPQIQNVLGRLANFEDRLVTERASVGAFLNEIDAVQLAIEDSDFSLKGLKSALKDVDLAEAITRFTQQQTVLQATQQSFVRIQGLSLFNYLQTGG
ncbi:MAG: flagellar hook-associated protein 3 [Rhodocyclaceae bacterium]|nr:flagellar hook-associated protein 3 [Rhodocyclaceae bacterium]